MDQKMQFKMTVLQNLETKKFHATIVGDDGEAIISDGLDSEVEAREAGFGKFREIIAELKEREDFDLVRYGVFRGNEEGHGWKGN